MADSRTLRHRSAAAAVSIASAAVVLATMNSLFGFDTHPVLIALTGARVPLAILATTATATALALRHRALVVLTLVALCSTAVLDLRIWINADPPGGVQGGTGLRLAAANVLYTNQDTEGVATALLAAEADVLVTVETTPALAARLGDVLGAPVAVGGGDASGVQIWTRLETRRLDDLVLGDRALPVVRIDQPGLQPVTVIGVHLTSPTTGAERHTWAEEWDALPTALMTFDGPVVALGDFNTSTGHRALRSLLERFDLAGSSSPFAAHHATWPARPAMGWPFPVPLLDLDHIVYDHMTATSFHRFAVPGSDHLGVLTDCVVPPSAGARR